MKFQFYFVVQLHEFRINFLILIQDSCQIFKIANS